MYIFFAFGAKVASPLSMDCSISSLVAANSSQPFGSGASSHGKKLLYLISLVAIPIMIVSVGCLFYQRRKSSNKKGISPFTTKPLLVYICD